MKEAMAGFGWLLAAGLLVLGTLFGAGTEYAASPVENTVDAVAESPAFNPCPAGWENTSTEGEEHTPVLSCQRDNGGVKWLAVLQEDGSFNYAFPLDTPNAVFIYDPRLVPGWP